MQHFDIIIIGAGPAGISMAVEVIQAGICNSKVLILEKGKAHAWSIRKLYQEKKKVTANFKGKEAVCHGVMCINDMDKRETLSYFDKAIKENNIKIHYQEEVQKITFNHPGFTIETNKNSYMSKVCTIAIGIFGRPNKPDLKFPAEIKKQVHFDITSRDFQQEKILVVGGGDSAAEYVQFLVEQDNQVTLSYRRENFSRMNSINRESLLALHRQGKVKILYNSNIKELIPMSNLIEIKFKENIPPEKVNHIIFALGGTTPHNFLKLIGIEFNGEIPILKEGNETTIPGLYLLGDLSAGKKGGSIISAFNSSKAALSSICQGYLKCKPLQQAEIDTTISGIKLYKKE